MKKPYKSLEIEIIRFGAEDVITTSVGEEAPDTPSTGTTAIYDGVSDTHTLTFIEKTGVSNVPVYQDETGHTWYLVDGQYYSVL